jgi:SulP family sulfate permease
MKAAENMTTVQRFLPVTRWLGSYQRKWLRPDVVGGLTVWALVVPESMAYAGLAGVPVQYGLYSVPFAVVGYLVFGTSRRLFVGPSSTVAVLSAATVAPLAAAQSNHYVALTAALALLVGVLYCAFGLLRMGFIARFFAKPVLDGFIVGLGLYIAIGQIYKVLGAPKPSGNTVQVLWADITEYSEWNWTTVAVGVGALAILFGLSRFAPRVPGALVVAVLGIASTTFFGLASDGVELVGSVPTGFNFVPWSSVTAQDVVDMVPGALGIIVVGFAQSLAIAKTYAAKENQPVDPNGELIGYGAASIGAGALQGFTPTGSLSKSAAATEAGGKSPVAFLVVAVMVVLTVLYIAPVFEDLPEAVLGAIVIHAVSGMIDFRTLIRLRNAQVADFWLALGALLGVILIGILAGIVIGVVLSLVFLVHRLDNPHATALGLDPDRDRYVDLDANPDSVTVPGVLVYRLDAPLIFSNAEAVSDDVRRYVVGAEPRIRTVVFDMEGVNDIDTSGTDVLVRLRRDLLAGGTSTVLARVHGPVLAYLERAGSLRAFGEGTVFGSVRSAVEELA